MIIRPVQVVGNAPATSEIVVSGTRITHVGQPSARARENGPLVDPGDAIAFPGLVNSHDHLEFNLYPALGHRRYEHYLEWGRDIHERDHELISVLERVPRAERLRWGALKNLLCGVTTVAHHGDHHDDLSHLRIATAPGTSIHSVRCAPRWRLRINAPIPATPYVFHVGEGTSAEARAEIDELIRWNLLRRPLVGVHAIAMTPSQARHFRAVVWCPVSNEFLYGATADVALLKSTTTILLGSDATLTADWNFWNHLRRARSIGLLDDRELFEAVTRRGALAWRRAEGGAVAPGMDADLVVARKRTGEGFEAFFHVQPEDILLVMRAGRILLYDAVFEADLPEGPFSAIRLGQSEKRVAEDVPGLLATLRAFGVRPNLPLCAAV
ncbi:MAG TPA: hypothetical protein VEK07_19995 [Polyangiaceae bacterium]|nr:hypothetical protein [Polyangiaceae bacterium]